MSSASGPVKKLRAFYKEREPHIDQAEMQAELMGQSDRAAVILVTSIIDEALVFRLSQGFHGQLTDKEFDDAFRFEGPLGTFSSRIEIATLFGLIDAETRGQLNDLREMRNACAHSKRPISFKTEQLANVAKRVLKPANLMPVTTFDSDSDIKRSFIASGMILIAILLEGSRAAGIEEFRNELARSFGLSPSPQTPSEQ